MFFFLNFFCWCCCYWCRFRCRSAIAAVSIWVMRSRPECIFIVSTLIEAPKRTKQFAVIHKDNNKTGKKLFQKKAQTKRVFLHSRVVHVLRSLARRFTAVKHYESVWCVMCVCVHARNSIDDGWLKTQGLHSTQHTKILNIFLDVDIKKGKWTIAFNADRIYSNRMFRSKFMMSYNDMNYDFDSATQRTMMVSGALVWAFCQEFVFVDGRVDAIWSCVCVCAFYQIDHACAVWLPNNKLTSTNDFIRSCAVVVSATHSCEKSAVRVPSCRPTSKALHTIEADWCGSHLSRSIHIVKTRKNKINEGKTTKTTYLHFEKWLRPKLTLFSIFFCVCSCLYARCACPSAVFAFIAGH